MISTDHRRRIDRIKASVSIQSLIERDGHKIVRSGGLMKCCCPFHRERTPSCVIYDDHAHCFGCHFHGDVFHYVMRRDGCDFKSALAKLDSGETRGIVRWSAVRKPAIKKEPELPDGFFFDWWLERRNEAGMRGVYGLGCYLGVDESPLLDIGCVWSEQHTAYAFPMKNSGRFVIGIRFRDWHGKKWALRGSKQGLFIPDSKPDYDLYVTEGPTDCAAMLSMGFFAIGKASAMQGPEEIVKFVQKNKIRRVIVIADNDQAGLNGAKKLIDACPVPCCELVLPAKDAREFYRNGGTRELVQNLLKSAVWRNPKHA